MASTKNSAASTVLQMVVLGCYFWIMCSASSSSSSSLLGSNKIMVGGSQQWRFGFNYSDWALNNGLFHINDTLVFKYDPPSKTRFGHSVYLLPNLESFSKCDLRKAKKIANWSQGSGDHGFEFVIQQLKTYYFACGEQNGFHCSAGNMKFSLLPILMQT